MDASHVTGGTLGGLAAIIVVGLLRHFGVSSIDPTEAAAVAAAAMAGGVAVAHAVWNIGLGPIFSRIVHGPRAPGNVPDLHDTVVS